ncbi:MAG: hypothetical protein Q7J09_09735 [Methanocalculus sp.]|uniref:hypothetical protein n=1 Tax=Methanocalculus sp. TaxID=2004547 RepID=UPI0027213839|nr:hypothetical protein [Methanocalculus sp.]MDO8841545.1 hypothetical protein [Methanocalculus sp.]MDO9540265.1 hypothetical protein [Methanocalculus sp.]
MTQQTYKGHCLIGDVETTKRKAKNECIRQLTKERDADSNTESWMVMFQGRYKPEYWIILLIKKDATLKSIDRTLRDLWLECCDHLSLFTICGHRFRSGQDWDGEDDQMDVKINRIFAVGLTGEHIYDFGSTTYLTFKVLDLVLYEPRGLNGIELIAQNDQPDIRCSVCGQKATLIWPEYTSDEFFFCQECFEERDYDEEMSLPVVNSPRSGVCGYCGDDW